MPRIYRHGLVLFALLAALAALDAALAAAGVVSWFNGLRWLRVHMVTLGIITQLVFGLVLWRPWRSGAAASVTEGSVQPSPELAGAPRPDPSGARQTTATTVWLILVSGIATLLVGIPLMNQPIIVAGGLIVMAAVVVTLRDQLTDAVTGEGAGAGRVGGVGVIGDAGSGGGAVLDDAAVAGRPFFVAALTYLLLGVFVGAGLWLGWGQDLGMDAPREVHIHANTWGFVSLAFAGLLAVTIRPMTGQRVRREAAWRWILWLLVLSGVLLLVGPWIGSMPIQGAGVVMHLVASAWVLTLIVPPLRHSGTGWEPWSVHLVAGYGWILALAAMVPVVMLSGTEFTLAAVEETAPQVLVYGWALQVAMGLAPQAWLAGGSTREADLDADATSDRAGSAPRPFGGWLTVVAINAGAALLAVSILLPEQQGPLYGFAYGLLAFGLAVFALRLRVPEPVLTVGTVFFVLPSTLFLVLAGAGGASNVSVQDSQTYSYEVYPYGSATLAYVSVANRTEPVRDYTDYKAESDGRLAAWLADPSEAPRLANRFVTITFREPQTVAELNSILPGGTLDVTPAYTTYTGVEFNISTFILVGRGPNNREETAISVGPTISSAWYGSAHEDPNCPQEPDACGLVTYGGVILLELELLTSDLRDLEAIQSHPDVYLLDTTGVVVHEELLGLGTAPSQLPEIDLPWPLYTATDEVVW